jgi:hypothetical protein
MRWHGWRALDMCCAAPLEFNREQPGAYRVRVGCEPTFHNNNEVVMAI